MTTTKQEEAWEAIRKAPVHKTTRREEFQRLLAFHNAKKNRPTCWKQGRSIVKGRAMAYGQVLRKSWIKSNVPIEKHFPNRT